MKLVLINPSAPSLAGLSNSVSQRYQPLGLACVAGLTPSDWEIVIEDENWQPAKFHPDADLVGVTAFTSTAPRAYELLKPYRECCIPTVMGGVHAWAMTSEALEHAGMVLVGEAETSWWVIHSDCRNDKFIGRQYQDGRAHTFAKPRRDLLDTRYQFATVQFTRGCTEHCIFCSVPGFSGNELRRQKVDLCIEDLAACKQQKIFVADDNAAGRSPVQIAEATDLFRQIAHANLDKRMILQVSANATHDDAFLAACQSAGVRLLLIGIEANDAVTLKAIGKRQNLDNGIDFKRVHDHGIGVLGAYVFGFDTDTPESLRARARYMVECGADCSQMTCCTPLPGTPLYRQMEKQGRLLYTDYPNDWSKYDFGRLVHVPAGFSCESEFYDIASECVEIAYGDSAIKEMARRTMKETGSYEVQSWSYFANANYGMLSRIRTELWNKQKETQVC